LKEGARKKWRSNLEINGNDVTPRRKVAKKNRQILARKTLPAFQASLISEKKENQVFAHLREKTNRSNELAIKKHESLKPFHSPFSFINKHFEQKLL
jgi:hypothetical protein